MTDSEGRINGTELTGVVLAGGLSSRLGHDKALVRLLHGDEPDLLARSISVLASCCGRVVIVGREHPDVQCYPDTTPGCGPVGGIATALERCGSACLVLSCDLPFMERSVLERLIACRAARAKDVLVTSYRQRETGHVEALVAIYEKGALPFFLSCAHEKKLKTSMVVPAHLQHFLDYSINESLPFFNINYPADLLAARKIMQALGTVPQ